MKKVLVLISVFGAGVVCGGLALYSILKDYSPASASADALEARADAALKVRLGEQETFLREFEANLPYYVDFVHVFGDRDFVRRALWSVRDYYEATATPIPDSIAPILSKLPPNEARKSPARDAERKRTTRTKVGDAALPLSLRSIDGEDIDPKGKVVLLNFFATWCGPCMAEMPRLEKGIWEPLRGRGVLVVCVGRGHSAAELRVFRDQKHFALPFVADPKQEIYGRFATGYIPRSVLIGKDGRIKYQSVGFVLQEFSELKRAVESEAAQ